jgi:hypothetical protein
MSCGYNLVILTQSCYLALLPLVARVDGELSGLRRSLNQTRPGRKVRRRFSRCFHQCSRFLVPHKLSTTLPMSI